MDLEINIVLDAACPTLVQMTDDGNLPETIFVHPEVYDEIARIRHRELENGFPLMLLGMRLKADRSLTRASYRLSG